MTIGACQDSVFDRNKSLKINLVDSALFIKKGDSILAFTVMITNRTNRNLLLYGLTILEESSSDLDFYRKPEITAGMVPYLTDARNLGGKNIYLGLTEEQLCGRPLTADSVLRRISETGNKLHDSQILLRKNSSLTVEYNARLNPMQIPKVGNYEMLLLYFSGINIPYLISPSVLQLESDKNEAIIFQGYAESNRIKLRVR